MNQVVQEVHSFGFTRLQQGAIRDAFRAAHRAVGRYVRHVRVSNRCFTDAALPRLPQITPVKRPMSQEEMDFVRKETGSKVFHEVVYRG